LVNRLLIMIVYGSEQTSLPITDMVH